ncbi:unnamed protein product [Cladocopium goreaui]|uniref:Small ribosomal subunit protein eS30 (40S ribosomal protein S30) n=1 Tax=Cladocopium goreaui TaxID=2562237 RepID=A0A9P1GPJ1_9DINO|nr:unnamed protein product [Cladocopium goreaui]
MVGGPFRGPFKWLRGAESPLDGCLYCMPSNADTVLCIDPDKQQMMTIGGPLEGDWKWHGGNLGDDGNIYGIPANATQVLKVDPRTKEVEMFGGPFEGRQKWYGGLKSTNGCIYGIPQNASGVLKIDPERGECSILGDLGHGGWKYHGGVVAGDGSLIYGIPCNSDSVLKIDTMTDSITQIGHGLKSGRHRDDDKYKYLGGGVAADGKVYFFPSDAERVCCVDPVTDEVKLIGPIFLEGQNKWQNGFSARDGAVYAIPQRAHGVLRINPAPEGGDAEVSTLDCGIDPVGGPGAITATADRDARQVRGWRDGQRWLHLLYTFAPQQHSSFIMAIKAPIADGALVCAKFEPLMTTIDPLSSETPTPDLLLWVRQRQLPRSNSFAQVSLAMGCSPAECAEAQGLLSEASASLAERMECFIAWCDLLRVSTCGPIHRATRFAPRRLLSDTSLAAMGKVHGSLARAGKVKNQTPKVAKAEKKKKLTGRAKKRFVYNRRFVSVVKSGPKRGPNSNAGKYRCSGDSTSPKLCDERERKIPEWCNIYAPSWQSMLAAAPPVSAVEGDTTDMVKSEPLELRASARYGRPSPPQGLWVLTILTFATSCFATYRAAQWVADEFLTSREYDPYLAQKLKHYPLVLVVVLSLVPIGLALNSAFFAPIFYHRAWLPSCGDHTWGLMECYSRHGLIIEGNH